MRFNSTKAFIRYLSLFVFSFSYTHGFNMRGLILFGILNLVIYIIPSLCAVFLCPDKKHWYDGVIVYHKNDKGDTDYKLTIYDVYRLGSRDKLIIKVDDEIIKKFQDEEED